VTVRVTTLKSPLAGVYYVEQLPSYYLQVGEPRGVWLGRGARLLGLAGEVDDESFLAVMAGLDPRRPDRHLGRRYDDTSVRGFDVTCSAPKSVSVLWALGDDSAQREVLDAHDAAVTAVAGWIEAHAHTRFRIAGEVAVVDAEGIVAAAFRQHTSRAGDPQLHSHLLIANRVRSPDGRWLALDARTVKLDQRTLSALYHAGLRAELTRRLGVRWEVPEHGIAEMVDIPATLRLEFSARSGEVQRRVDEKLDRFADSMGREPTVRERWQLEREAVVDSRPAKPKDLDAGLLRHRWADQTVALGLAPAEVAKAVLNRVAPEVGIDQPTGRSVVDRAITAIGERQSTWRPAELVRELAAAVPTTTSVKADRLVADADVRTTRTTPLAAVRSGGGPAASTSTSRAARRWRARDSRSRTPRCGDATTASWRSHGRRG
jgi:conjugative relaxase-like TrwC/TraI family protein